MAWYTWDSAVNLGSTKFFKECKSSQDVVNKLTMAALRNSDSMALGTSVSQARTTCKMGRF